MTPTRLIDPHDEHPTERGPRARERVGRRSPSMWPRTGSPLGVASENSACLPAGRACDLAGAGWVEAPLDWPTMGTGSTSDTSCWSIGIQ